MAIMATPRSRPSVPLARQHARLRRTVRQLRRELASIRHQATHDPLTGLLNRAGLTDQWHHIDQPRGLLLVDLDEFKPANDRYGHLAGDVILAAVGTRLTSGAVTAARLGGDEFVVVVPSPVDPVDHARSVAARISRPVTLPSGSTVTVRASIGVYLVTGPVSLYQAIECADLAMYAAKAASGVVVYTPALSAGPTSDRRRDMHEYEHQTVTPAR